MTCTCEGWKPKLRSKPRCEPCQEKFDAYVESGWGLDEIIEDRLNNQNLSLCFHCGAGLTDGEVRLCRSCSERSEQGRWCKEMIRKGGKPKEESNPYTKIWEANDNGAYLTPTLDSVAVRMQATARYHQKMAEKGGPRGDYHAEEAAWRFRVAEKLQKKYADVGTTQVVNWYVKGK